jgi:hypothetical protein
MAVLRIAFLKMVQSPKWLISQNRDDEVFNNLRDVSIKYNRSFSLTLERLQAQGQVQHAEKSVWNSIRLKLHFSGLFETRKLAWSTTVIIANWFAIGMVSPLYSVFLPFYLRSRGAISGGNSYYVV